MLQKSEAMNDKSETPSLSVRKPRQSKNSRRSSLRLSAFEDEATVATSTNESDKEITVQNFSSCKHDPWYYSSNHVLINQERVERGLSPLHRRRLLDEKARAIAKNSAAKGKLKKLPAGCKGNISRGSTIRDIHWDMMTNKSGGERKKILNKNYNAFGMGTHKGEDGRLYLVQLFEKTRIDQ